MHSEPPLPEPLPLSQELLALATHGTTDRVSIQDLLDGIRLHARATLLILFAIPNLLPGSTMPGHATFQMEAGPVIRLAGQGPVAGKAFLALRPEVVAISATAPGEDGNSLTGRVEIMTCHGSAVEYQVRTDAGLMLTARATARGLGGPAVLPKGTQVWLHWPPSAGVIVSEH